MKSNEKLTEFRTGELILFNIIQGVSKHLFNFCSVKMNLPQYFDPKEFSKFILNP